MLSAKDLLSSYPLLDTQYHAEQTRLLQVKRLDTRKAADLAAGRLIRIRLEFPREQPIILLVPPRVAAFVCQVLGPATGKGVRVALSSQDRTSSALYPKKQANLAVLALLSHGRAVVKKECRRAGQPMPSRAHLRQLGS